MRKNGNIDNNTNFYAAIKVTDVYSKQDDKRKNKKKIVILKQMKEIGFNTLYLGFESGSNRQLKRYNKGTTREENLKAIKILKRLKINIDGGFINFDPLMTFKDCLENISFLKKAKTFKSILYPFNRLVVFPNTNYKTIYEKKINEVDSKIKKLYQIIEYIDRYIPYSLFELFLQQYRHYCFSNDKNNIIKFIKVVRSYEELCFPFIIKIIKILKSNNNELELRKYMNLVNYLWFEKIAAKETEERRYTYRLEDDSLNRSYTNNNIYIYKEETQ